MRHIGKIVFVVTAITATVMYGASQTPPQKPSFEAASVKRVNEAKGFLNAPPDGRFFSATGFTLKWLICHAYGLRNDQVLDGPLWINTDLWEIQAKAADGRVPQPSAAADNTRPATIALMLQSLLEERFQLRVHRETREFPVYILGVGNGHPNVSPDQNIPLDSRRG
jgi:uncharacterized protein (TIGR03435 family)